MHIKHVSEALSQVADRPLSAMKAAMTNVDGPASS